MFAASCFSHDVCSDDSVEEVFTDMPAPSPGAASDAGAFVCVELPDEASVVCVLSAGQGNAGGGGKGFVNAKGCGGPGTAGQAKLAQSVSSP